MVMRGGGRRCFCLLGQSTRPQREGGESRDGPKFKSLLPPRPALCPEQVKRAPVSQPSQRRSGRPFREGFGVRPSAGEYKQRRVLLLLLLLLKGVERITEQSSENKLFFPFPSPYPMPRLEQKAPCWSGGDLRPQQTEAHLWGEPGGGGGPALGPR